MSTTLTIKPDQCNLEECRKLRERIVIETRSWLNTPYADHCGLKHCGVDCFYLPARIYQAVGLIPKEFEPPYYSPQQWLNSPAQTDKLKLKVVDTTALDIVLKYCVREIKESEVQAGDLAIYKIVSSWTHGAIVISWPDHIIHAVKGLGVIGSHGTKEGMVKNLQRRFFTFVGNKS